VNNPQFIDTLQKLRPSSTFLALSDYHSSHDEIADYSIVFHVSYESLLQRSLEKLSQYQPQDDIEAQAKKELMDSYSTSLKKMGETGIDQLDDGYRHFYDDAGKLIKGVKLHEETNTIHLYGTVVNKKIKKTGVNKEVKSKDLTLAKKKLSQDLPVSKWRQFKIQPDRVAKISVENLKILSEDLV